MFDNVLLLAGILIVLIFVLFLVMRPGKRHEYKSFAGNSKPDDNVLVAIAMASGATYWAAKAALDNGHPVVSGASPDTPVLADVMAAQQKRKEAGNRGDSDGGDGGVMLLTSMDSGGSSSDGGDSSCGGGGCGD